MQTLFGSLFGLFGTAQLLTVLLLGMLVLTIFKPERIGSWPLFRVSVVLFVLAVAVPGLAALFPSDPKMSGDADRWLLQVVLSAGGLLTTSSIYCLLTSIASR